MSLLNLILWTGELTYTEQVINGWRIGLRHALMFRPELRSLFRTQNFYLYRPSWDLKRWRWDLCVVLRIADQWCVMAVWKYAMWEIQDETVLRLRSKVWKLVIIFESLMVVVENIDQGMLDCILIHWWQHQVIIS